MTVEKKIIAALRTAGFTPEQADKMAGPVATGANFLLSASGRPLSDDYFDFTRKIGNIASALGVPLDAVRRAARLSPTLVIRNADTLAQNVDGITQRLKINRAHYVDRILRYAPHVLSYTADTVQRNIRTCAAFIGMPVDDYIPLALKHPTLFATDKDSLHKNAQEFRDHLGLSLKEFQRAVRSEATLIYRKADGVAQSLQDMAEVLGVIPHSLTAAILHQNQQQMMVRSATTVRRIVDGDKNAGYYGVTDLLGVPRRTFIQAAMKRVSLFAQSARRTNYNAKKQADLLGVDRDPYAAAVLKRAPQLLTLRPQNILDNAESAARLLGIEKKDYVTAVALKAPQLLYQSADTIDARVTRGAAAIGVDKKEYVAMALLQPSLFYRNPDTIGRNARLMEMFHEKGILEGHAKDFFRKKPDTLCLATDNFHVRYLFARMSGLKDVKGYGVLRMPRHEVESKLARLFGHDPEQRVVTRPIVRGLDVPEEDRRHRAFVGLIRRGIIRTFTYQPE